LVDLFGKKKLEDSIVELESDILALEKERDELKQTLEKREEKIRKLTFSYQEASIALKAFEQKAAAPASQIRKDENIVRLAPKARRMRPIDAEKMLKKLSSIRSKDDDLLTAYLDSTEKGLPPEAKRLVESIKPGREIAVLHCPQVFTMAILPPMQIDLSTIDSPIREESAFFLDPIFETTETPVLLVSAHAGDTFLGVALNKDGFEAEDSVKTQVKEKHSKGGWSQKRFERLREEDIRNHAEAVMEKLSYMEEKYRPVLKYAVLSGDQALLKQISPGIKLPIIERKIERHDDRQVREILEELYQFTIYRSCGETDE
jgi:hypothetical protein